MKRCIRSLIAFCLLVEMLAFSLPSFSQTPNKNKPSLLVETSEGLMMARIVTPQGIVRLNLPDDTAAGDAVSGTVSIEPNGSTEAERTQNAGVLNGYVFDLGNGTKASGDKPTFSWTPPGTIPSTPPKYVMRIVEVLAPDGTNAGTANIPILSTPPPAPSNINIPGIAQSGHNIPITGPFDGNASTTGCTIGGQPVPVVAESPRKTIVKAPTNITGPTQININDGSTQTNGTIRIVGVALSAPKTALTKGETTVLTMQVIGLQGITEPVPLQIVTTGVVNMQGGNTQSTQIQPSQVSPSGTFTQTYGLTGTQTGNFNVVATVITNNPAGGGNNKCQCKCEFSTPNILSAGKRSAVGGGTEYSYEPNVKISCNGNRCEVQSVSYSWSIGAASTATYNIHPGTDKVKKLVVDVTKSGTLVLSVTVTVTCSDGSTCTATGSKTFDAPVASSDLTGAAAPTVPGKPPVKPPGGGGGAGGGGGVPDPKDKCKCTVKFAKPPILSAGKRKATGGGSEYSFTPNAVTGCSGNRCEVQSIAYSWSVDAKASTATYTIHKGTDTTGKLVVDVTKGGTLVITVTVTVTCSDGTTCSDTGTATFTVKE